MYFNEWVGVLDKGHSSHDVFNMMCIKCMKRAADQRCAKSRTCRVKEFIADICTHVKNDFLLQQHNDNSIWDLDIHSLSQQTVGMRFMQLLLV